MRSLHMLVTAAITHEACNLHSSSLDNALCQPGSRTEPLHGVPKGKGDACTLPSKALSSR